MTEPWEGFAVRDPYLGDPSLIDLWWAEDHFHRGTHGSYLSALMMFGAITGIDPASFGATEKAAADLGISKLHAMQLQGVASPHARRERPCARIEALPACEPEVPRRNRLHQVAPKLCAPKLD